MRSKAPSSVYSIRSRRELKKRRESRLAVSLPKCLFGFKEKHVGLTAEEVRRDLTTKLMMDLLFGSSTELYQRLYDEDLISDSFGHEYNSSPQYAFSAVGGDTKDPDQLLERIRTEVDKLKATGFQASDFERARKKKMGGYLRMLNSLKILLMNSLAISSAGRISLRFYRFMNPLP